MFVQSLSPTNKKKANCESCSLGIPETTDHLVVCTGLRGEDGGLAAAPACGRETESWAATVFPGRPRVVHHLVNDWRAHLVGLDRSLEDGPEHSWHALTRRECELDVFGVVHVAVNLWAAQTPTLRGLLVSTRARVAASRQALAWLQARWRRAQVGRDVGYVPAGV